MTGIAASAARMVEDGLIKVGGAELWRARLMLGLSADAGIGEEHFFQTIRMFYDRVTGYDTRRK